MDIKIFGKTYAIRSGVDTTFTHQTADLVNRRMRELTSRMGPVSAEKVAVLAAMNFAGELLRMRNDTKEKQEEIQKKARKILKLIDARL